MKKYIYSILVLSLLLVLNADARWPEVNSIVPGTNGQCLTNSSGKVGAVTCGSGGVVGDALTTNPLSQFAATTSVQLAATINDETGTGVLVFGTNPSFTTGIVVGSGDGTATTAVGIIRGPNAVGTDIPDRSMFYRPGLGTGLSNLGQHLFSVPVTKLATGSTAHTNAIVFTIGAAQAAHPGTSGFVTASPALTVNDEITAGSGTAALASAHSFLAKTFTARNTLVTTTDVTTMYLEDSIGGTNNTATNSYSLIASNGKFTGLFKLPGLASSSAATTGTLCWTTGTGNVNVDTTTTCLLSTLRVKEHVKTLSTMLPAVMKLRPVEYDLKMQYNPEKLGRQVGLIAEEVQKVDTKLVALDADGLPKGVRYQQLTAVLVKAIQEQQVQIHMLEKRLAKLESK